MEEVLQIKSDCSNAQVAVISNIDMKIYLPFSPVLSVLSVLSGNTGKKRPAAAARAEHEEDLDSDDAMEESGDEGDDTTFDVGKDTVPVLRTVPVVVSYSTYMYLLQ